MVKGFKKTTYLYLPENYVSTTKSRSTPFNMDLYGYLCYSDIYSKKYPINEILNKLSKYRLLDILKALSGINLFLQINGSYKLSNQIEVAGNFLSNKTRNDIHEYIENNKLENNQESSGYVLFHRAQLLLLMQWALMVCSVRRGKRLKIGNHKDYWLLGEICLMINDYIKLDLIEENQTDYEKASKLAQELVLSIEMENEPHWNYELARLDYLLNDFWPNTEVTPFKLFEKNNGIKLQEYRAFIVGLYSYFRKTMKKNEILNFSFIIEDFLRNTTVDNEIFNKFLRVISKEIDDYSQDINEQLNQLPTMSFSTFRRYPLMRFGNEVFCADTSFLMELASLGIFWILHNQISEKERDTLHQNMGISFQNYVIRIFEEKYPTVSGQFYSSPKDDDGNELADGLLYDGERIAVLEFKSIPLSLSEKYKGTRREFLKSLEKKLLKKGNKIQLANNINRIFQNNKAIKTLKRLNIDTATIRIILPVIICSDRSIMTPFVHDHLRNVFNQKSGNLPANVSSLSILSINGLEMVGSIGGKKTFLELVEESSLEPSPLGRGMDYKLDEYINNNNIITRNQALEERGRKISNGIGSFFWEKE